MKMLTKCSCMVVDGDFITKCPDHSRILIDIREPSMYEKTHISNAINLLTSNLLLRRLQRGSLHIKNLLPNHIVKRLEGDTNCSDIILYDTNSTPDDESREIIIIGSALKKEFSKKNIYYLNGGFKAFCANFPSSCEFNDPLSFSNRLQISIKDRECFQDPTDRSVFSPETDVCPVSILPFLYLGSAAHSSQRELLERLGITAILNVSRTCPEAFRSSYEYKSIPVDDNANENISCYFDEAIQFIDSVKEKKGKVLLHCRAGVSRSATICIAYLMRKCGYTLDEAYEFTKKKRSTISPNLNFLGQLLKLENELSAKSRLEPSYPSTAGLSLFFPNPRKNVETKQAPLTCEPVSKTTQMFTYTPNSCMNIMGLTSPETISPFRVLLTPS